MLASKGLTPEDFEDKQKASEAADVLVKAFQSKHPSVLALHPDKIFPDIPMLDSFWYAEYTGIQGCTSLMHI